MANQSLCGQRDSEAQEHFKFQVAELVKIYAQPASSILSSVYAKKGYTVYCFGYFL